MADLKYKVEVDTSSADRSLSSLKQSLAGIGTAIAGAFAVKEITRVSSAFEDLRTSLQILYKDTATGSKAFDEIKKFAATSVFSVEDLTQTVIKLKAAGLEPTVALLQMFANTSSVAADKVGALQAITDLYARTTAGGLGLEDLNRLADRGIPVFDILQKQLGKNRLELTKLGQTSEGAAVILKALENGLTDAFGNAGAMRAQNLSQAMSNFSDEVSNLSDLIGQAGLNAGMRDLIRAFADLLHSLRPVAAAIGYVLGGALQFLAENIKIVTAAAVAFLAVLSVNAIINVAKAFAALNLVIGKNPIVKVVQLVAGLAAGIGVATAASDEMSETMDKLNKKLDESNGPNVFKDGKLGENADELRKRAQALNEELRKFRIEMRAVGDEFQKNNNQMLDTINLENSLIGKSKEYADAEKAREEIYRNSATEVEKLRLAREKLNKDELKEGRGEIIDAQIERIRALAEVDAKRITAATENANRLQAIEQVRQFGLTNEFNLQQRLADLQFEVATSTLPAIQKKYAEIDKAANDAAMSAIRAEEQRLGRKLNTAEQQKYYDEATKGTEALKAKQGELYEESRKFSTGWKNAFNEYVDNATNAAAQAQQIFSKVTSSMEDALVNFAKTGKFEFKSMVNSIIEDLLRMQIKATMAKLMGLGSSGTGGAGGLFGGKIIPGILASGGPVSGNRPYIVGERGPELFMPSSNGQMFPNSALGGGQSVVYNIQAVDAPSFQALVARDPRFIHAVAMAGAKAYAR